MEINLMEAMKRMSEQEIFEIAQMAKIALKQRLERDSVYEPTGDPTRDQKHYERIQMLREMLSQLGEQK